MKLFRLGRYGESPMKSPEELKDKIIHARLQFGDALIMASDVMNERPVNTGDNISLSVDCDNDQQLEEVFSKMATEEKLRCLCRNNSGVQNLGCLQINLAYTGCLTVRGKNR